MKTEFSFFAANDWVRCTTAPGAREIVMNNDGTPSRLTTARGKEFVAEGTVVIKYTISK